MRYGLLTICLWLGFGGYALHIAFAISAANTCDRISESDGKVDTACKELRYLAIEFSLYAVSNKPLFYLISLAILIDTLWSNLHYCWYISFTEGQQSIIFFDVKNCDYTYIISVTVLSQAMRQAYIMTCTNPCTYMCVSSPNTFGLP